MSRCVHSSHGMIKRHHGCSLWNQSRGPASPSSTTPTYNVTSPSELTDRAGIQDVTMDQLLVRWISQKIFLSCIYNLMFTLLNKYNQLIGRWKEMDALLWEFPPFTSYNVNMHHWAHSGKSLKSGTHVHLCIILIFCYCDTLVLFKLLKKAKICAYKNYSYISLNALIKIFYTCIQWY